MGVIVKTLWILFIAGQILNAGNMNYAQENGYYEENPIYSEHPSKQRVYATKAIECVGLYGLTKAAPKYEKPMLVVANIVVWGMIYRDKKHGIELKFRW